MTQSVESIAKLETLLGQVAVGDSAAFSDLYDASSGHLYALLLRMLKRRDWAEEALQDCFISIWQKSESYDPEKGAPLTWLIAIARYRALDLLRVRRPEVAQPDDAFEATSPWGKPDQSPEHGAQISEGINRLDECLETLKGKQKNSVLLTYYEGYTHRELAQAMQAPLGTAKSWVRRGLASLRECLES